MKILFLYTKRMLAANKARTAVTFAGIVLSFALLTAVLTGTSSLFHFFSEYMKMRDGDYYGVIYNCDEEDEARLAQSGEVMQICRMGIVGVAEKNFGIEHEVSLSNRVYVAIGSVDADFFATMGVRLIEGRLPENDSEVIIPQMMTTAGKEFHIGDTITWQIGERIGSDGRVIQHQEQRIEDRSSADFCEEETIQVEQTKTYTIVGVSTNPGYQKFAEPCYLVLTTGVQTTISDIYLKTKSIDDTSDFIAKNFGDHQSKINETLLRYFGQGVSDIRYMLFGMCAVLMVVVAIASIALIYNSFSISLTERTRQFGLFKSSVKDRTGETQEYTAESAAAENTLPLEVVKYQQLDINQIGKVLYDMSEEQVEDYLRNQGKDPYFYLGVSTNGEGFYSINSELGDYYTTVLSTFSDDRTLDSYFSAVDIGDTFIDAIGAQIEQCLKDAGFLIAFCEKYALCAEGLNQLQKDLYDEEEFKLYAPGAEVDENGMQTGELNRWKEEDEVYLFYYYMAYHNTYVASVSGRNRIQIVYSPSKHQVVYGNGNLCPILTQEVVSSKEVYSLDENEAIALAKKALSEAGIKDARFVSAKPVYVNNFGDISFEDQTMTLIPAWRVEYTVEKNGKTIRNWLHLNAETGEVYDNTIKL